MPAKKYQEEAKYLLRMEAEDKAEYIAAAKASRRTLADWINDTLRAAVKRALRSERRPTEIERHSNANATIEPQSKNRRSVSK